MNMQENTLNEKDEFSTYSAFFENVLIKDRPTRSTKDDHVFEDMPQVRVVLEENTHIYGDCNEDMLFP